MAQLVVCLSLTTVSLLCSLAGECAVTTSGGSGGSINFEKKGDTVSVRRRIYSIANAHNELYVLYTGTSDLLKKKF